MFQVSAPGYMEDVDLDLHLEIVHIVDSQVLFLSYEDIWWDLARLVRIQMYLITLWRHQDV